MYFKTLIPIIVLIYGIYLTKAQSSDLSVNLIPIQPSHNNSTGSNQNVWNCRNSTWKCPEFATCNSNGVCECDFGYKPDYFNGTCRQFKCQFDSQCGPNAQCNISLGDSFGKCVCLPSYYPNSDATGCRQDEPWFTTGQIVIMLLFYLAGPFILVSSLWCCCFLMCCLCNRCCKRRSLPNARHQTPSSPSQAHLEASSDADSITDLPPSYDSLSQEKFTKVTYLKH